MRFTKMQGAGNDFIIIDNIEEKIPHDRLGALAERLCTRRLSIGADGLMAVETPAADGDCRMLFYNSDGTPGEMCGNGARCIARYAYEKGLAGDVQRIETPAGLVIGERIDQRRYKIRLNDPSVVELDKAIDLGEWAAIPGRQAAQGTSNGQAGLPAGTIAASYVELGDPGIPHAVVEMPGLSDMDRRALFDLGRALCHHPIFPKGANINFYEVTGQGSIRELTYERGVEDFTMACGTGTGSTAAVLALKGIIDGSLDATMAGGLLHIDVTVTDGHASDIYLTGPTNIVAEGEVCDEELNV